VITFNGEIYNYLELREELIREHGAEFATTVTPR
jgi:asparagine synthase (glutamine-hydrolysing)